MTQFWFAASTEEFPPSQMLEQAKAADQAGFDAIGSSDHFVSWFPGGQGASAWAYLPAAGQVVADKPLFTSVTPILHHYHPAVVAQFFMNLEELYPGRAILGVGSAEAISEVPLGLDWPEPEGDAGALRPRAGGDHAPLGRRDRDDGRRLVQARRGAPDDDGRDAGRA